MKSLVLTGGGARGAYQIGVLKAISEMNPDFEHPFDVICGTSAGALNAAGLASGNSLFRHAIARLEKLWAEISSEKIYRTDFWGLTRRFGQFTKALISGESDPDKPISLLDNSPLRGFLEQNIDFKQLKENISADKITALCVTACGYRSGQSINFFQTHRPLTGWHLGQRIGCKTEITIDHLLASSAIPMVFPPIRINREYFGDGVLRLMAPLSPAIHLGARNILVVGVSANRVNLPPREATLGFPSLSNIMEHMLNGSFIDVIEHDMDRAMMINKLVKLIPEETRKQNGLDIHPLEILEISPSKPINDIAQRHLSTLPKNIQRFVGSNDHGQVSSSSLASYLMFEKEFSHELIDLGYQDAQAQSAELVDFFQLAQS